MRNKTKRLDIKLHHWPTKTSRYFGVMQAKLTWFYKSTRDAGKIGRNCILFKAYSRNNRKPFSRKL